MPGHLETYVTCAGPDKARPSSQIGGVVGTLMAIANIKALLYILGAGLFVWIWMTSGDGALMALCAIAPAVITAAVELKHWYYHERLLCLRGNDCAVGIVIDNVEPATDGDRKLNLLLAPMTPKVVHDSLAKTISDSSSMLTNPANFTQPMLPTPPPLNTAALGTFAGIVAYIKSLSGSDPDDEDARSFMFDQIGISLIDTLMLVPGMNVYERYLRRVATTIPDPATFDHMPVDFAPPDSGTWQTPNARNTKQFFNPVQKANEFLNPLFRVDRDQALPFLHCEIDGHQIAIWCDDAIVTASGVLAGCFFFGPIGGAVGGGISWLLKKFFDWLSGNDGDAAQPNVQWDDPNAPIAQTPNPFGTSGDIVAVFGTPVMDCEHHQWMEIHPVRAYYVMGNVGNLFTFNDSTSPDHFSATSITKPLADRICNSIQTAENATGLGERSMGSTKAQSLGMDTTWGNGTEDDEYVEPMIK